MGERQTARLKTGVTAPQDEFHRSDARFRAFVSGVGAGKTWAGCVEILRMPPGTTGVVIAPTYPMLYDATLMTFNEVCGPFMAKNGFSKQHKTAHLVNGTKVIFRSADDPEKLRGPNLSWAWMDEAAMMEPMTWEIMLGRLRRDPGRMWITTTPKGMSNWVYKIFVREADEDTFLVNCATSSNIFLPDYFIDSLSSRYSGAFKQQEFEGMFVNMGEHLAYQDYRASKNLADNLFKERYNPQAPLHLCCDFNVAIMSWPVVQVHQEQGVLRPELLDLTQAIPRGSAAKSTMSQPYVLTEVTNIGRISVRDQCSSFRKMFPAHNGPVVVYGDATGQNASAQTAFSNYDLMQEELGPHYDVSFMVPRSNPRPFNRIVTVNDLLRGTGYWLPLQIDREECPVLMSDLESVTMNDKGDDVDKIRDPHDDRYYMTHSSDGLGYWASMEVPIASTMATDILATARDLPGRQNLTNDYGYDDRPHGSGLIGV